MTPEKQNPFQAVQITPTSGTLGEAHLPKGTKVNLGFEVRLEFDNPVALSSLVSLIQGLGYR